MPSGQNISSRMYAVLLIVYLAVARVSSHDPFVHAAMWLCVAMLAIILLLRGFVALMTWVDRRSGWHI